MEDPWANAWNTAADDEQDISVPSWDTTPAWSDSSLWATATDKSAWQSTYDDIPLTRSDSPNIPEPLAEETITSAQLEQEPQPAQSHPSSPDAFGTFETGLSEHTSTVSAVWAPADSETAWGGTWGATEEIEDELPTDEWEAAKQRKEKQDQHVPPELLASILSQVAVLYPAPEATHLDPNDYRTGRKNGLDLIINTTLVSPGLTLVPIPPFSKSAIAKGTTDALRLSRNATFIRHSPLGHYSATKGSTAWEASVKNRPEVLGEPDLLPPGWRIVDSKLKVETVVVDKKKHGGLLSFFGRRSGTPPIIPNGDFVSQRSASPVSVSSPRASSESSMKSPTNASMTAASPTTSPNQEIETKNDQDLTPASSTISRFLGRFGRKNGSTGSKDLSLSVDDVDFLADIDGAGPLASGFAPIADFSISTDLLDDPIPLPAKLAPPPPPVIATLDIVSNQPKLVIRPNLDGLQSSSTVHPLDPPSVDFIAPAVRSVLPADEIDFSAWHFDDEMSDVSTTPALLSQTNRQPLNTRAVTANHAPLRKAPTAIMSSGSTKSPVSIPKLHSFFPPPPGSSLSPPMEKARTLSNLLDDDFSGFSDRQTDLSSSTSSQRTLLGSSAGDGNLDAFDDFNEFMEASPSEPTTLRTPSPPRPPAKPPRSLPAPLSLVDPDDTPLALMQAHQRTKSLVDSAAASSGIRWPAPASPVPELLPPPDTTSPSTMQSQQAAFLNRTMDKKLTPLPVRMTSQPVLPFQPPLLSTASSKSTGGLSAQDLSFFEGL
ncbi:hypothetical protein MIND_00328300 [Mycena indigotica]|uniref:Uncharacterized protein n=1 Tax=Mycena indigotica TaxID=2126181 RepID=A0A8H6WCB2_9AGAR|nr:uncharacterized protein MIND_00328300 [Mycena indigotica]KAF7309573.1 hypothetical protein MIND_00328300 [Mycena indigotica]